MAKSPHELYSEQFRSGGELPQGPVSTWPKDRKIRTLNSYTNKADKSDANNQVKASIADMASGAFRTGAQALRQGKCSTEVRTERLETCMACPHFLEESARCSLCGCYMKAKTWVGGDPKKLCPAKKWVR